MGKNSQDSWWNEKLMNNNDWNWDNNETDGFNFIAKFESTLIKLGILNDYSDIDSTEIFDEKYSPKN